jgi:hypothetical protein
MFTGSETLIMYFNRICYHSVIFCFTVNSKLEHTNNYAQNLQDCIYIDIIPVNFNGHATIFRECKVLQVPKHHKV